MKGRLAAGGAVLTLALAFVGAWEGRSLTAYLDPVGVPTICDGITEGVHLGQSMTAAECDAAFAAELRAHEERLRACLVEPDKLPGQTYVAVLSWAYNVGTGAACRSTLVRKLNAGDLRGACDELPRWVRAGGRVLPGLKNRRVSERGLCLEGLQ